MEKIRIVNSGEARNDACSYIALMEDSQFIVALMVAQAILSFLDLVRKALQAKESNLADAYKDVAVAKECIKDVRNDRSWEKVWARIEQVAKSADIRVEKPRTARVQCHWANAAVSQSSSDYYRVNVYYPFIDRVVQEFEVRFANSHEGLVAAHNLIPSNLLSLTEKD